MFWRRFKIVDARARRTRFVGHSQLGNVFERQAESVESLFCFSVDGRMVRSIHCSVVRLSSIINLGL